MAKDLTDQVIRSLKPKEAGYRMADIVCRGLFIFVSLVGRKI